MLSAAEFARDANRVEVACTLVEALLAASHAEERSPERRRRTRVARMLRDPRGKHVAIAMADEVVRFRSRRAAARRLHDVLVTEGMPTFIGRLDRLALRAAALFAPLLPRVVVPLLARRVRHEARPVVLPAEDPALGTHLARRHRQGVRVNLNVLGEAVLGEDAARRRLRDVIAALRRPDVDYVSVKLSAVCSQINVLAFDDEVERLVDRLRPLYEQAARSTPGKFVNLDMEEYRDLHLTLEVFRRILDDVEFRQLDAGIVLQAYLPDSYQALVELCEWATERKRSGGGRVKVRLVKGANLAMEEVEAELRGWAQAPYRTKAEVDANFKRMLDVVLQPKYADAVRVGVGSHNLFDIAWALVLREELDCASRVEIEMLEGMAPAQARAVHAEAGDLLLYAPVAERDNFDAAIAYLIRRLDENTAPENFLRALFSLERGSAELGEQRARFVAAVEARHTWAGEPRRRQDRNHSVPPGDPDGPFANEPDTDFSLPANRLWIQRWLEHRFDGHDAPALVPAVVDGEEVHGTDVETTAPARQVGTLIHSPAHVLADSALVDRAVAAAQRAGKSWSDTSSAERRNVLHRVADVMAAHRGRTVAAMAVGAGKTIPEGDAEVSEACDFARYYADATRTIDDLERDGLSFETRGTVVVASPWNFPYAIPAGGVLAALAMGNAVILKPAPETVEIAWMLASQCWEAGVPRDLLQLLPCPDDEVGRRLITHEGIDTVILTGAYETARMFLDWKPDLHLLAETSGKNAIVVTAAADVDAAVRDLVQSAFGHAGQKCSAASLGIIEASVYEDTDFRERLSDAVRSLAVGPGWDARSSVGPLIRPPGSALAEALERLDHGETWLVQPRRLDDTGCLWAPGVKLGVRPGSPFHMTECFGPVLGLMRAKDLDEAIELQNATPFGLTGGIHSLDPSEVERWKDRVELGNAYVNRGITGAIVRRQPFGGWKRSSVGATAKAGGPNYLLTLARPRGSRQPAAPVEDSMRLWWEREFGCEHDPSALRAERNVLRYRPLSGRVIVRVAPGVSDDDVETTLAAAAVAGVPVTVSSPTRRRLPQGTDLVVEDDASLIAGLTKRSVQRLRLLGSADETVWRAAHEAGITVDAAAAVPHGRIELLHWVREQAVTETMHRHGNIRPCQDEGAPRTVDRLRSQDCVD